MFSDLGFAMRAALASRDRTLSIEVKPSNWRARLSQHIIHDVVGSPWHSNPNPNSGYGVEYSLCRRAFCPESACTNGGDNRWGKPTLIQATPARNAGTDIGPPNHRHTRTPSTAAPSNHADQDDIQKAFSGCVTDGHIIQ